MSWDSSWVPWVELGEFWGDFGLGVFWGTPHGEFPLCPPCHLGFQGSLAPWKTYGNPVVERTWEKLGNNTVE